MKKQLLARLSSIGFVLVELRLFLDTHPHDKQGLEMFEKYNKRYTALKAEYEANFGPLTITDKNTHDWICDPWPWDNEFNVK